jgi:uncharacterized protein (TIRG00374 family)
MKRPVFRWLLPALRYGLCALAIAYLVHCVPWYDHVRLGGPEGPQVRLIQWQGDQFVVLRGGRRETLGEDQVHHVRIGEREVPEIERGIATVVPQADKLQAFWAILIFLPVVVLQIGRLVVMLAIQGVRLSFWTATKLTFVGNFFNFALPGTTGGDLIKAYYLTHYTHLKTEAVTTVFLDRAIGLLGLILLAGAAILLTRDPQQFAHLTAVLAIICGALAAGGIVVFSGRLRRALRLRELAARLPMGEQLLRVGRATVAMRQHKLLVVLSLLMTLALQAVVMVSAAIMAWALRMQGEMSYYFIYVSIGFLIAAIPISPPQAFGVMEYFYVLFFAQGELSNDASQAVALALAVRLIQLVWALPGVLVPLLGAHLPRKAELERLEAEAVARPSPAVGGRPEHSSIMIPPAAGQE